MVDRRDVGSWLQGPGVPGGPGGFAGERLGRPASGPGAIAGTGRRLLSLMIDWVLCLLITRGLVGPLLPDTSLWAVAVLVVMNVLLIATAGATIGQRLVGVQVESVTGGRIGPGAATIRAVILGLGIPPLTMLWEKDQRGLHELASRSLVALR